MESSSCDEENVVGLHMTVPCGYYRSFEDGQDVSLDSFSGNVRSAVGRTSGYFINFINEDDTFVFRKFNSFLIDGILIEKFFRFQFSEDFSRFLYGNLLLHRSFGQKATKYILEIDT